MLTKEEATKRLSKRWHEQCHIDPMMRDSVPLERYIAANIRDVRRDNLLEAYASTYQA